MFFSHINTDSNINDGNKLLKRHLKNAALIAQDNLYKNLNFSIPYNQLKEVINDLCIYHDLGKYTSYFQEYLTKGVNHGHLSHHSHIGAFYFYNKYYRNNPRLAIIGYFIIKNHHSNFNDFEKESIFNSSEYSLLKDRYKEQYNNLVENLDKVSDDIEEEINKLFLTIPEKDLKTKIKYFDKQKSIENYFLINYLFSLLIEADKIDASNTPRYTLKEINKNVVNNYLSNLKIEKTIINELRKEIRQEVAKNYGSNLLNKNIFTLTAPTGSGKTLLNLEFALHLREEIYKNTGKFPQIVYSLPFISIIEQTEQVIKKVIGNEIKILAHYQFNDLFDPDYADKEDLSYSKRIQLLETWQSDIVVTSFVQLLQTLISNRNKFLKKFNHFANSIIILDEVQAIKSELLPIVGAALYYLTKFLNCKILLSTATFPFIFELAKTEILDKTENIDFYELLKNHNKYFSKINRTKLIPAIDKVFDIDEFFEFFTSVYKNEKSCLVVCNTINNSLKLYDKFYKEFGEENVFYLSTNIISLQKEKVIKEIKERLRNKSETCKTILISTQVIEAGVDLDFEIGFRELSPIDSIIQTAGRINRNYSLEMCPIYIFDLGTCQKVYGAIAQSSVKTILTKNKEILESDYLTLINDYYKELYNKKSFSFSKNIFNAMLNLKYHSDDKTIPGVSSFRLIEDDNFENSVFVEIDDDAKLCYQKFCDYIDKKIDKEEFAKYSKLFNKYSISIPKHIIDKNALKGKVSNLYYIKNEILDFYYNNKTGFIRKEDSNLCL